MHASDHDGNRHGWCRGNPAPRLDRDAAVADRPQQRDGSDRGRARGLGGRGVSLARRAEGIHRPRRRRVAPAAAPHAPQHVLRRPQLPRSLRGGQTARRSGDPPLTGAVHQALDLPGGPWQHRRDRPHRHREGGLGGRDRRGDRRRRPQHQRGRRPGPRVRLRTVQRRERPRPTARARAVRAVVQGQVARRVLPDGPEHRHRAGGRRLPRHRGRSASQRRAEAGLRGGRHDQCRPSAHRQGQPRMHAAARRRHPHRHRRRCGTLA